MKTTDMFKEDGTLKSNKELTKMFEDAGLKGKQIGGAMVSEKHANFIINADNASGEDIYKLIDRYKKTPKPQRFQRTKSIIKWK